VLPHPLDLVALILGILFTLRQMDIANRHADRYPGVAAHDFERWKRSAQSAYRWGSSACFAKVLLDIAFAYLFGRVAVPPALRWTVGLSLDVGWVALVVYSYVRVTRARALGRSVGTEPLTKTRTGPSGS
jgi:hypothetical protein